MLRAALKWSADFAAVGRVAALALLLGGCAGTLSGPEERMARAQAARSARRICGWESFGPRLPRVELGPAGVRRAPPPGAQVLVVLADRGTEVRAVLGALEPVHDSLVRLEVPVQGRWLLPITYPNRPPVSPPSPEQSTVRLVGSHRIRRFKGAPADRFADLHLDGERVELWLETEGASQRLPLARLAAALRKTDPPARVFALRPTPSTRWRQLVAAVLAAACYDRAPGEEPHEVILD